MKKTIVGILAFCMFAMTSCDDDAVKPCSEERTTAALISDFPDSLKVGNTHTLDVRFVLDNSCGEFERFEVTNSSQSFEVRLITKYEGCNCNLAFSEKAVSFDIDIDFPGLYEFKFWQTNGEYDTRVITIYE